MDRAFKKYWNKLLIQFYLRLIINVLLWLFSSSLLLETVCNIFDLQSILAFQIVYHLSVLLLVLLWHPRILWNDEEIIRYLHHKYPKLEYSLGVFQRERVSELEEIQKSKVKAHLPKLNQISFDFNWQSSSILLVMSVLFWIISIIIPFDFPTDSIEISKENSTNELLLSNTDDSLIFDYELKIYPAPYTRLRSFIWKEGKKIPEYSKLIFSNRGEIDFDLLWQNKSTYSVAKNTRKTFNFYKSSLYEISYLQQDSLITNEPKLLEITEDAKPSLSTNLEFNRYEIKWEDLNQTFSFNLKGEDDYGINSIDAVMTLSRGEGESVKFREMKASIMKSNHSLKAFQNKIKIPLDTFDLNPGDELYFYFEAKDNNPYRSQFTRTDVYFLSIEDTAEYESVEYEGFALTNEAEYFKSQRQIIIDTEALLEDKSSISQLEFEGRSNNIGADQKVLRLRYGVFLGEEFETTGGLGEIDHSGHDHGQIESGEDEHEGHDHENESGDEHSNFSNPIYNETPELAAYVHAHDESELSTFLDAEVKAKLKEALANMWEAELYLRTYKPKDALPYEYQALKLIKEVKRASRIYVQRLGFEPPPIDEARKRLTGEMKDIKPNLVNNNRQEISFNEKIRNAYQGLNSAYIANDLEGADKILNSFVETLIIKITNEPVRYSKILVAIKAFQNDKTLDKLRDVLAYLELILELNNQISKSNQASLKTDLLQSYYQLLNE
ncbi:hypothetical protein [Marivirga arenosa]|uniref:DUF4175 domain-containing protein n=1 Tax=Marivirga arenosa TaxID=3059076 RepID=A0AA49GC29_9BACT|nr:hypothetical protein [Marivirga sp. BKB1-2]WKK80768.2 hypothetical protein QYS47_27375 [Marivirga sp. BKB1-2]